MTDEHEHWLDERDKIVTASDAATILGLNPFGDSPLKVALRKLGEIPRKQETEAMRMGHVMQPVIKKLYADETDRKTRDLGDYTIQKHPKYPFAGATLDYKIDVDPEKGATDAALECKNVGARLADSWDEGAPLYVQIQLQYQLACTDWDWGSVAALLGGNKFVWVDYERNDKFIAYMMGKVEAFWTDMQDGKLPEATEYDKDALLLLNPKHKPGTTIELPVELRNHAERIVAARETIAAEKKALERSENRLRQFMTDHEYGVFPDGEKWTYRTVNVKGYTQKAFSYRVLKRVKHNG